MALTPERKAELSAKYGITPERIDELINMYAPKPTVQPAVNTGLDVPNALKKGTAIAKQALVGGLSRYAGAEDFGQGVVASAKQDQERLEQEVPSLKWEDAKGLGGVVQYGAENTLKALPLMAGTAAGALAGRYIAPALKLGKGVASVVGGFLPALAAETGIISSEADQIEGNRGQILKGAASAAALESLGTAVGLGKSGIGGLATKAGSKFFKGATEGAEQVVKKSIPRKIAGTAGDLATIGVTEAATESAQSPLEAWGAGKPVFKEGEGFAGAPVKNTLGALSGGMLGGENFTPEMKAEMKESFFAGGAAGLGLGGAGKTISSAASVLTRPAITNDTNSTDILDGETTTEVPLENRQTQEPTRTKRKGREAAVAKTEEEIENETLVQEGRDTRAREAIDSLMFAPEGLLNTGYVVSRKDVPQTKAFKDYVEKDKNVMFDSVGNVIVQPQVRAKFKTQMDKDAEKAAKQAETATPAQAKAPKDLNVKEQADRDTLKATKEHANTSSLNKAVAATLEDDPAYVELHTAHTQTKDPLLRAQIWQEAKAKIVADKGYKVIEKEGAAKAESVIPKQGKGIKAAKPNQVEGSVLNLWAKENAPELHKAWNDPKASKETKKAIRVGLEEAYKAANGMPTEKVEVPPKREAGTTKEGFKKEPVSKRTKEDNKALDAYIKTKPELQARAKETRNTPDYKVFRDEAWQEMQGQGINAPKEPTTKDIGKGLKRTRKPAKAKETVEKAQAVAAEAYTMSPAEYIAEQRQIQGASFSLLKTMDTYTASVNKALAEGKTINPDTQSIINKIGEKAGRRDYKSKKGFKLAPSNFFKDYTKLVKEQKEGVTTSRTREDRTYDLSAADDALIKQAEANQAKLDKEQAARDLKAMKQQAQTEVDKHYADDHPFFKAATKEYNKIIASQKAMLEKASKSEIEEIHKDAWLDAQATVMKETRWIPLANIIKNMKKLEIKFPTKRPTPPKVEAKATPKKEAVPVVEKKAKVLDSDEQQEIVDELKDDLISAKDNLKKEMAKGDKLRSASMINTAKERIAELEREIKIEEAKLAKKTKILESSTIEKEPLFNAASKRTSIEFEEHLKSDKTVGVSSSIKKNIKEFVDQIWKDFGLKGKVFITTESDVNTNADNNFRNIYSSNGDYVGMIISDNNGGRIIALNDKAIETSEHMVNTICSYSLVSTYMNHITLTKMS